jgi:hypothetical protein
MDAKEYGEGAGKLGIPFKRDETGMILFRERKR